jgi:hypothetical protein
MRNILASLGIRVSRWWVRENCRFAELPIKEPVGESTDKPDKPVEAPVEKPIIPECRAVITQSPKGLKFFKIYGNTWSIKDRLKEIKNPTPKSKHKNDNLFSYFKGTWSAPVYLLANNMEARQALEDMGVSTSLLDDPSLLQPVIPNPTDQPGPIEALETQSSTDKQLAKMKAGIDKAIKDSSGKPKEIFAYIDRVIDQLANQVDEAAASEFVQSFLAFSAKFYNYSFSNQMLIWIQKPMATKVAGASDWFGKFGRAVTNWDNYIWINAPIIRTTLQGEEEKKKMPKDVWEQDKKNYQYTNFKQVKVYDVEDTQVVEGWVGPNGEKPFKPAEWRQDPNDAMEEITALVNASLDWGRAKGIDVDSEEMASSLGGYSAGGKVRINSTYDGINKFSTLIHELAHEILHQNKEYKEKSGSEEGSKHREIDAETVAYVVLKHYGFETKDTPRYLALWKATGEDVKQRRNNIVLAVKEIVRGIDSAIGKSVIEVDDPETENKEKD